jgi:hypothetical protein
MGIVPDLNGEDPPIKLTFDEKYFHYNWNDEHPPIEIPSMPEEEIDNDWIIPNNEKKEEMINDHVT